MKRLFVSTLAAVLASGSIAAAIIETDPPFTVYVFATPSADGFTDSESKARADSAADLVRSLRERGLVTTNVEKNAHLTIEVRGRELRASADAGAIALPIGNAFAVLPTRQQLKVIHVQLRIGEVVRVFEVPSAGTWSSAADQLAKDIGGWIAENRAKIWELNGRLSQDSRCAAVRERLNQMQGATLAARIRAANPGSFSDIDDARLERIFMSDFPCLGQSQ